MNQDICRIVEKEDVMGVVASGRSGLFMGAIHSIDESAHLVRFQYSLITFLAANEQD